MSQINVNVLNLASNALSQLRYGSSIDSRNINNADNPYYVRSLAVSEIDDAGMMKISSKRMSNYFLTSTLNHSTSDLEFAKERKSLAESVDTIVTGVVPTNDGKSANPISQALSDIIRAANGIASDDTYSSRNTFLSRIKALMSVVGGVEGNLEASRNNIDSEVVNNVSKLNSLATQISKLNKRMLTNPNGDGLLLQRDTLIGEMSKLAKVDVDVHKNGSVDIRIGAGYTLVSGRHAYKVKAEYDEYGSGRQIAISGDVVNPSKIGGQLGASIKSRDDIVRRSESSLARVVVGYMGEMNRINQSGYVVSGAKGNALFEIPSLSSVASSNNKGDATVTVGLDSDKIADLQSPLILIRTTGGYEVKQYGTDNTVKLSTLPASAFGFKISSVGSMSVGDSFKIDPLPEMLASTVMSAKEDDIAAATKSPVNAGDKSNIENFANIADRRIFNGSTDTVVNELANTFVRIGNRAVTAAQEVDSSKSINKDARSRWDNLSGVNTQEEEMNIVRLQQTYQSAAKIISASKDMFNSLISVI
ncbi:flagellar hook-associated protein FlgK [Photobacterium damselae]|uniref:flagellar hook-associated protein FlgK n=1 Tax=Photobacterium damselae TaxID=38293 RepID=UPI0040687745